MDKIAKNIKFGLRIMARNPGFTFTAILALALGIGANTAIFTVVDGIVLKPLSYPESSRLALLWERQPQMDFISVSYLNFLDWREQQRSFENIAAVQPESFILTGLEQPERLRGSNVSYEFFDVLRAKPLIGRTFTRTEEGPGSNLMLISESLWERRFGRDHNVLGKQLRLSSDLFTIIGVMPSGFNYPISTFQTEVWTPLGRISDRPNARNRGSHPGIYVVGRLLPQVSFKEAEGDMARVAANLARQYPDTNKLQTIGLDSLQTQAVGTGMRTAGFVVLGAVGFVLLIACANVANLLLARASTRSHEIAVRSALGAGRGDIVKQLLTESVLLSVLSGALGLLIAYWGVDGLKALIPSTTPRLNEITIDARVLSFTFVVSLLTGLLFGLVPAMQASNSNLHETVNEGGRRLVGSEARQRWRNMLIVGEVALSVILLIGAGLMIQSFVEMSHASPGMDLSLVATATIALRGENYKDPAQQLTFAEHLLDRVRALPGVERATITTFLPLFNANQNGIFIEGQPRGQHDRVMTDWLNISPDYFSTLGIRVLEGRAFTIHDREKTQKVAIVDETLARKYFPGQSAVGKKLYYGSLSDLNTVEIVGVVDHVKHYGLDRDSRIETYLPFAQIPEPVFSLAVKTAGDPAAVSNGLRAAIAEIDRDVPLYNQAPMRDYLARSMTTKRLSTVLFGLFAGVAMLLSAIGIYGVISYSVTQRTQEIGIRMALGARSKDVLRLVFGQGGVLIGLGVAIGVTGAMFLSRLLGTLLYNVSTTDFKTFLAAPLMLAAIAFLATYVPARRAMRVDPMQALRYE
jgi:putative ABC transport system permease protein